MKTKGRLCAQNTKLKDAKYYDEGFDQTSFTNLYPFLPAHFEILLRLLGALAKSTGGVGLAQQSRCSVMFSLRCGGSATNCRSRAWMVGPQLSHFTTSLGKDIRRAFASIYGAVDAVAVQFSDDKLTQDVAKTIAVLQILANIPISLDNRP